MASKNIRGTNATISAISGRGNNATGTPIAKSTLPKKGRLKGNAGKSMGGPGGFYATYGRSQLGSSS